MDMFAAMQMRSLPVMQPAMSMFQAAPPPHPLAMPSFNAGHERIVPVHIEGHGQGLSGSQSAPQQRQQYTGAMSSHPFQIMSDDPMTAQMMANPMFGTNF